MCKKHLEDTFEVSNVDWYFREHKLESSQKYRIEREQDSLILNINQLNRADQGVYSLHLQNRQTNLAELNIQGSFLVLIFFNHAYKYFNRKKDKDYTNTEASI